MASSGRGLRRPQLFPIEGCFRSATMLDDSSIVPEIANDWQFSSSTYPVPVPIPYTWLAPPVRWRDDNPVNAASVRPASGNASRRSNDTSIAEYGEYATSIDLNAYIAADAPSLAEWLVTYYADPRQRTPELTINLLRSELTTTDRWRLLDLQIGDQIEVTDVPAGHGWPDGATLQVIEGIHHTIAVNARSITLRTSPVIGAAAGVTGPWFRPGESTLGGSDDLPF